MFKKIVLIVVIAVFSGCLMQFIKESALDDPEKIYESIYPIYKDLTKFSVKDRVCSPRRKIVYTLRLYNVIPIGNATMFTKNQSGNILVKTVAMASNWVTQFYRIEATSESLIDRDKLYPLRYTEVIITADKERKKEIRYYPDRQIMERDGKKYKIPAMTFCPISVLYYLRVQDLVVGEKHKLNLISKEELYIFEVEVIEKKGKIFKLIGEVRRKDLSSLHGAKFTFWLAEDLRIPLLFKVSTPVGNLTGRAIPAIQSNE